MGRETTDTAKKNSTIWNQHPSKVVKFKRNTLKIFLDIIQLTTLYRTWGENHSQLKKK